VAASGEPQPEAAAGALDAAAGLEASAGLYGAGSVGAEPPQVEGKTVLVHSPGPTKTVDL
jgi:hypothetical protein